MNYLYFRSLWKFKKIGIPFFLFIISLSYYARCDWSILRAVLSFVVKLLRDLYRQIFSTYIANKSLKLSFTLNCVLKRAEDFKRFQIDSFSFRPASEN